MDEYQNVSDGDGGELLTVLEAASILRIGRTTAYALAQEFLRTNGASGLPVIRVGKQLRVRRARLYDVLQRGTVEVAKPVVATEDRPRTKRRKGEVGDVLQLFSP
jgi:hypothetical protein